MCLIFLSLFDMNVFDIPIIVWYECVWYSYHCLIWMCLIFLSLFNINVFDIPIIVSYGCVWYSYHCLIIIWMCLIFLSLVDMNVFDIPIIGNECVWYSYHCLMNVFDIPIIVWYACVWYSYHCLMWMCLIFLSLFDIPIFECNIYEVCHKFHEIKMKAFINWNYSDLINICFFLKILFHLTLCEKIKLFSLLLQFTKIWRNGYNERT